MSAGGERGDERVVIRWIIAHARALVGAVLVVGIVIGALLIVIDADQPRKLAEPASDTPPAEFLYLDSARVLAYLGQARGGLSTSEKRTLSATSGVEASVKGGLLAELKGSTERETSIEETVSPDATDRFLTLLAYLRAGSATRGGKRVRFLQDMDARMRRNSRHDLAQPLERLAEGDFLRLRVAHIFLAPFAALAPRAAYAAPYVDGQFLRRQAGDVRPEVGPDVAAYLAQLGEDPELPFVVPILDMKGKPLMTFIVPARYSGLLDNARLLAGNLTVVGKVIYIERRFPGDPNCNNLTRFGCTYVDHTTAQTFAPALQKASPAVRRLLGLGDQSPAEFVRESVTFTGPLVVLLPVAIFQ